MASAPTLPDDEWERDATLMLVGWLLGTVLAVALLLTVVRSLFV